MSPSSRCPQRELAPRPAPHAVDRRIGGMGACSTPSARPVRIVRERHEAGRPRHVAHHAAIEPVDVVGAEGRAPAHADHGLRGGTSRGSAPCQSAEPSLRSASTASRSGRRSGACSVAIRRGCHFFSGRFSRMCSSRSCFGVASRRRAHQQVLGRWFIGNSTISRRFSSPASSMTMRSTPGAMPPCGGAPYWKARYMPPNRSSSTSSS